MVAVAEQFYPLGLAIVHDVKRVLDHRQGGAHEEHLQHNRQHKHSLPVFVHRARVRVVLVSSIYFTLSDGGTVRISDGNACGACTHHRTCTVYGSVPRGTAAILSLLPNIHIYAPLCLALSCSPGTNRRIVMTTAWTTARMPKPA